MNFLGLLVEKGRLSAKSRADVEAELAQKHSLADALSAQGVSLADALAEVGAEYSLPTRILGDPPASEEVFCVHPD